MPDFKSKIKYYQDEIPLFNRYQIENQIQTAFEREVALPSGGSIVIDITEAMVSIDINSSRATKGGDIEETAYTINLEAAEEIARQLRLRDVGGLIVIDFIDMLNNRHQKSVENKMREALEIDRARVQVGRISRFGLMEMSRQRLRPSLEETMSKVCPRCNGQGTIRGTRSLALSILRLVEEEAQKEYSREIRAIVPISVATFLLNEKRSEITSIESRNNIKITVLPNSEMQTPNFEVVRIRTQDEDDSDFSYKMANELSKPDLSVETEGSQSTQTIPTPAVKTIVPNTPAPQVQTQAETQKKSPSLVQRLWNSMFGEPEQKEQPDKRKSRNRNQRGSQQRRGKQNNQRNRNNDNRSRRGEKSPQGKSDSNQKRDSKNDERQNDNRSNKRNQRNQRNDQSKKDNNTNENTAVTDNKQNEESGIKRRPDDRKRGPRRRRRRQDVPQEMLENTVDTPNTETASTSKDEAPKDTVATDKDATPKRRKRPATSKANESAKTDTVDQAKSVESKPEAITTSDPVETTEKPKRKRRATKPKQANKKENTSVEISTDTAFLEAASAEPKAKAKAKAKAKPKAKATPKAESSEGSKPDSSDKPKLEAQSTNEPKAEVKATGSPSRASNDPRSKPKASAKVETSSAVRTSKKGAPTTSDSPVVSAPKESAPVKRASNDPRQKRAVEKTEEKPSEG
jgi:ribonuclease E